MQNDNPAFFDKTRKNWLFILNDDISESYNRTSTYPEIAKEIEDKIKEKREKTLESLALRTAQTVMRTGRTITLEPMQAYERKIIHSFLQENPKVETRSIGQEPRRRIVISKK